MAAFMELDWSRFDVFAIVALNGIATVVEQRRAECLEWLERNGYAVDSLDCSSGLIHAIPELGRILKWEQQFGYTLEPDHRNLDALRDGFEFDVPEGGGKVFELVRPDVAWREDARWLLGLLAIAEEASRTKLALGSRFFTVLVIPEASPLIAQVIDTSTVPAPHWHRLTFR